MYGTSPASVPPPAYSCWPYAARIRHAADRGGALLAGLLGGVSELSLYGIHLHHRRVYRWLLAGCAAGGVTSAVFGWLFSSVLPSGQMVRGVTTTAFAFSSLLTIPVFDRMWCGYVHRRCVCNGDGVDGVVRVPHAVARATKTQMVSADENARPQDMARGLTRPCRMWSLRKILHRAAPDRALDSNAILSPVAARLVNLEATGDPVFASPRAGGGRRRRRRRPVRQPCSHRSVAY